MRCQTMCPAHQILARTAANVKNLSTRSCASVQPARQGLYVVLFEVSFFSVAFSVGVDCSDSASQKQPYTYSHAALVSKVKGNTHKETGLVFTLLLTFVGLFRYVKYSLNLD